MSLIQMSFAGAMMVISVIVIRALFMYKLPKKTFLVLWAVVALRLMLPIALPAQTSIFTIWENLNLPLVGLLTTFEANSPQDSSYMITDQNWQTRQEFVHVPMWDEQLIHNIAGEPNVYPPAAVSPLAVVWLVGVLVSALFFASQHIKWRKEFMVSLPIENEFVIEWLKKHRLNRQIQIRVSDRIATPLTYGILSPVILMPKNTNWKDEKAIEYVLAHEFVHIKRFDALTKFVAAAVLCVHWFNPLVWAMYVLFNRDMEISCDESVIKTLGGDSKSSYAMTLIEIQEKNKSAFALYNAFSKYAIEERVTALIKTQRMSFVSVALLFVLLIGTTAVFATAGVNAYHSTYEVQSGYFQGGRLTDSSFPDFNINMLTDYNAYGIISAEEAVEIAIAEFIRLFADRSEDWEYWSEVAFNMSFDDGICESTISSIRQDNPQEIPIWNGIVSTDVRSLYELPALSFIINAETGRLIVMRYAPITQRFDPVNGIDDLFGSMFDSAVTSVEEGDEDGFNFQVAYEIGEQATFEFMPIDEEWAAVVHVVIEFLE